MAGESANPMLRIGIFYDGQYFLKVSNYYVFQHERHSRIDIHGLHQFIKHEVANAMEMDQRFCRIVDAHYFRGRLSARDADSENKLYNDRVFDDILMGENVTSHYMPLRRSIDGRRQEKGVDVWLALEAYEQAFYRKYDMLVLIACDGDYVPLVRKITALGQRVMLVCWDFKYRDEFGNDIETRTSQTLLDEVTFPVIASSIIDDRVRRNDPIVSQLFIKKNASSAPLETTLPQPPVSPGYNQSTPFAPHSSLQQPESVRQEPLRPESVRQEPLRPEPMRQEPLRPEPMRPTPEDIDECQTYESQILSINNNYGFIRRPPDNVFFHFSTLENIEPYELRVGMHVKYNVVLGEDNKVQAGHVWLDNKNDE